MDKLSHTFITKHRPPIKHRHPTILPLQKPPPENLLKSIPYNLVREIYTILTNKNLRKTRLKELYITLHQRGYPTTLMNKGFEFAEKKYH